MSQLRQAASTTAQRALHEFLSASRELAPIPLWLCLCVALLAQAAASSSARVNSCLLSAARRATELTLQLLCSLKCCALDLRRNRSLHSLLLITGLKSIMQFTRVIVVLLLAIAAICGAVSGEQQQHAANGASQGQCKAVFESACHVHAAYMVHIDECKLLMQRKCCIAAACTD